MSSVPISEGANWTSACSTSASISVSTCSSTGVDWTSLFWRLWRENLCQWFKCSHRNELSGSSFLISKMIYMKWIIYWTEDMKSSKAILKESRCWGGLLFVLVVRGVEEGAWQKKTTTTDRQILCKSLFCICFSSLYLFLVRTKLCMTAIREIPSLDAWNLRFTWKKMCYRDETIS